jgi:hypothetical protein
MLLDEWQPARCVWLVSRSASAAHAPHLRRRCTPPLLCCKTPLLTLCRCAPLTLLDDWQAACMLRARKT